MLKVCKYIYCILLLFLFSFTTSSTKENEIEQFISISKDFTQLEKGIHIIKKHNNIFKYVPSLNPINPMNESRFTSGFGKRFHPIEKQKKGHYGLDIACECGTLVYATADGIVAFEGIKKGYGIVLYIEHKYGFETRYAHLSFAYVRKNRGVKKGEIIGFVGNTGASTGNHLHYEVRKNLKPLNPIFFLDL